MRMPSCSGERHERSEIKCACRPVKFNDIIKKQQEYRSLNKVAILLFYIAGRNYSGIALLRASLMALISTMDVYLFS